MLITEPKNLRITRLLPNGTRSTFASLGTAPFGPAVLNFGNDGKLYVSDGASGRILRVESDGSFTPFANIPLGPDSVGGVPMIIFTKDIVASIAAFGGSFIASTFTASGLVPNTLGAA
jgi:hypothetical protein